MLFHGHKPKRNRNKRATGAKVEAQDGAPPPHQLRQVLATPRLSSSQAASQPANVSNHSFAYSPQVLDSPISHPIPSSLTTNINPDSHLPRSLGNFQLFVPPQKAWPTAIYQERRDNPSPDSSIERIPRRLQETSDYLDSKSTICDLISTKFDAIITSIDSEIFSGDEQDLGQ